MYFFFLYFFCFFYQIAFFCIESIEDVAVDSKNYFSLEKLSEYRILLKELTILDPKNRIEEIIKGIKNFADDAMMVALLRSLQNYYIQIEVNRELIEKSIYEYELIIDEYLVNKYESDFIFRKKEIDVKDINKLCIEQGKLDAQLLIIEKKITSLKKEDDRYIKSLEKSNIILTEKTTLEKEHEQRMIKSDIYKNGAKYKLVAIQSELFHIEKYVQEIIKKVKKFQVAILETKKHFIKEKSKDIKIAFQKAKKNLIITEKLMIREKENQISLQKKLFEERDADLKSLDVLMKENEQNKEDIVDFEKKIEQISFLLKKNTPEGEKELSVILESLLAFIKKDFIKVNILINNAKIYIKKKQLDLFQGWYIFTSQEINLEALSLVIENINNVLLKNIINENKIELKKYLDKISNYIKILNNIIQLESDIDLLTKYKIEAKKLIDGAILKNNRINNLFSKFKNIFYIAVILQEELKGKTFWARSEYSISFFKLKNFFSEMKLFFFEVKNQFFPYLKKISTYISAMYKQSMIYLFLPFLLFFAFFLFGFLYKKILLIIIQYINTLEDHSYYTKKINGIFFIFANQSIFLYIWFNFFILIYYKIILLQYTKTIFYLSSIPFIIYFVHNILNQFTENHFIKEEYSPSWRNTMKKIFFERFFINTIIVLFFLREALISIIFTSAHEIILAAEFILVQIQLIILLKKNYIMQYIGEIKFINQGIKEIIATYYKFFLTTLIALIVMSNPYVGYGNQVLYVLSRSLMTIFLIPLFEKIFEFIKNKLLIIFFNFEGEEAKNKIQIAKIIYTLFLTCIYFAIFIAALFVILRMWGYIIEIKSIFNLLYQNLLPENHMLSSDKITSLSISTLFIVFSYIIRGYIISYCISKFVFSKILHPIIISQPLQNTIMTLSKYIILFSTFVIGLYAAGLQSIITKLGAIIIGIGFAIKEPFADFFSYFIILIQRPIKVGDLIKINRSNNGNDPEVIGIVRSINSRTTIIRQRNSQTIIIPNSVLLTRSICNWTFHKSGFTSVEDFVFVVKHGCDVDALRMMIMKTVESHPAVIKNPLPLIRCEGITPLGYDILVRAYISPERAADQWDIASQLRILIIKKLELEKIPFAIPEYKVDILKE